MTSASILNREQLLGLDEGHLQADGQGRQLHAGCWDAFSLLRGDARDAGFDLEIASAFRGFERQRMIWNGKASGQRPVHDDRGQPLDVSSLDDRALVHAILRFSALPGASRHHWGSDLDVYDAAAVAPDYPVQLTPAEVADDGPFGPLHLWLDGRIQAGAAHGFYRPYATDRGGVAPERWHLSFAPLASNCMSQLSSDMLRAALADSGLLLLDVIEEQWEQLYQRYISNCDPQ